MNKLQKIAFFNLCMSTVCLLIRLLRLALNDRGIRLIISVITIILCCLMVASYFLRLKIAKLGGSQYDERDRSLHNTALIVGMFSMFMVIFAAIMITFIAVGPGGTINVGLLFDIFLFGTFSWFFAESLTFLIKYGWKSSDIEVFDEKINNLSKGSVQ